MYAKFIKHFQYKKFDPEIPSVFSRLCQSGHPVEEPRDHRIQRIFRREEPGEGGSVGKKGSGVVPGIHRGKRIPGCEGER